jgi:hypothetical protein
MGPPGAPRGTLIVVNGNFIYAGSKADFTGPIIIRRSAATPSGTQLFYKGEANSILNGFAHTEGNIYMGGSAGPYSAGDILTRPGYFELKFWSWRECYINDASCNF